MNYMYALDVVYANYLLHDGVELQQVTSFYYKKSNSHVTGTSSISTGAGITRDYGVWVFKTVISSQDYSDCENDIFSF